MRFVILPRRKERFVGRDQRQAARISKIDQARFRRPLGRQAVALQFDIETVAEQALQLFAARERERVLSADERHVERPIRTAGERDQAIGLGIEPSELDMRPFLRRRLEKSARRQPHQAAIARFACGEQHDPRPNVVYRAIADFLIAEVEAKRAADDRLDADAGQFFGKFERTEHVVGVGERQCRLTVLFRKLRQARNRQRALEQRIGRMNVQMHEGGFRHCFRDRGLSPGEIRRRSGFNSAVRPCVRPWRIATATVHRPRTP